MSKITIIAGHYGSGKTNVAVALALELRRTHEKTALADLDIVNPYFRAADSAKLLFDNGITPLIPIYANTNVDIPVLPESLRSAFDTDIYSVFDVGGDDDGAAVLAPFKKEIEESGYEMYCVINMYRPMTASPEGAAAYLRAMEQASALHFCGLINNSNLGSLTVPETVTASLGYADKVSELTGLPVYRTTALTALRGRLDHIPGITYIENTTKQLF